MYNPTEDLEDSSSGGYGYSHHYAKQNTNDRLKHESYDITADEDDERDPFNLFDPINEEEDEDPVDMDPFLDE